MATTVNRETFLRQLEMVLPGVSPREIVEQSSCFAFSNGEVLTFNDEVSCRAKSPLKNGFAGAVQSDPLLKILRKMPEDEIRIEAGKEEMIVEGRSRRAGIRMEAEVTLPINSVELPKKWKKLPKDFLEALGIVQRCAAYDASQVLVCVHINPHWIEAGDQAQLCHWKMETGVAEPILVRQTAVRPVVSLGMTEYAETDSWLHFKNKEGLIYSCRRYIEKYPDTAQLLVLEGATKASLPKGLAEAGERAEVFSEENEKNQVKVELRPGKIRVRGRGTSGWYVETRKSDYSGPPMSFMIAPELLIDLVKNHSRCEFTSKRLRVKAGKYTYIACLSRVKKDEE